MSKPFVQIIERGHGLAAELWLGAIDAQKTFVPLGDTGPVRMPLAWALALQQHEAALGVKEDGK